MRVRRSGGSWGAAWAPSRAGKRWRLWRCHACSRSCSTRSSEPTLWRRWRATWRQRYLRHRRRRPAGSRQKMLRRVGERRRSVARSGPQLLQPWETIDGLHGMLLPAHHFASNAVCFCCCPLLLPLLFLLLSPAFYAVGHTMPDPLHIQFWHATSSFWPRNICIPLPACKTQQACQRADRSAKQRDPILALLRK